MSVDPDGEGPRSVYPVGEGPRSADEIGQDSRSAEESGEGSGSFLVGKRPARRRVSGVHLRLFRVTGGAREATGAHQPRFR